VGAVATTTFRDLTVARIGLFLFRAYALFKEFYCDALPGLKYVVGAVATTTFRDLTVARIGLFLFRAYALLQGILL